MNYALPMAILKEIFEELFLDALGYWPSRAGERPDVKVLAKEFADQYLADRTEDERDQIRGDVFRLLATFAQLPPRPRVFLDNDTHFSEADLLEHHRRALNALKIMGLSHEYQRRVLSDFEAAFDKMGSPAGLTAYGEEVEHFGDVQMHAYDLRATWERYRQARQRKRVMQDEALWVVPLSLPISVTQAWELVTAPGSRKMWQDMIAVSVLGEEGRPAPGTRYHCVHKLGEFFADVVDWEPFEYFTVREGNAFHPHLRHDETYTLSETEDGVDVVYTMGPMFNPDDPDAGPFPDEDAQYRDFYIGLMIPWFDELKRQIGDDVTAFSVANRWKQPD